MHKRAGYDCELASYCSSQHLNPVMLPCTCATHHHINFATIQKRIVIGLQASHFSIQMLPVLVILGYTFSVCASNVHAGPRCVSMEDALPSANAGGTQQDAVLHLVSLLIMHALP